MSVPSHSLRVDWSLCAASSELLGQVSSLESDNYPADEACTLDNFHYRLTHASPYFRVARAVSSGMVLGFCVGTLSSSSELSHATMFQHDPQGTYLCIHSVCVARLLQRQGLGREILREYLRQVRSCSDASHVRGVRLISKAHLIPFYESCGFTLVGPSKVVHGAETWYECKIDWDTTIASAPTSASASAPLPVWLDCDPGHDDAMAIMLAGHHPSLQLIGLSTVAGNQSIEKTTINARNVLNICGLGHLPVHPGRNAPIKRPSVQCPEIHGECGLGGPHFPKLDAPSHTLMKAYEAMADAIVRSPVPLTIIATGPLTNVALLALTHPELMVPSKVKQIVLMGGAVGVGNTGPAAEFNIQVDPEAAAIVFESGVPITMVPLEVTHTALVTDSVLARVQSVGGGSNFAQLVADLMLFFRDSYRTVFGFDSPPLHDPCAVAWLIAPDMFTSRKMRVDVECESALCYGRTVCDVYRRDSRQPNVEVCLKMDVERFWQLMIEALEKSNEKSVLNTLVNGAQRYEPKHIPHGANVSNPPIENGRNQAAHVDDTTPLSLEAAGMPVQNFPTPAVGGTQHPQTNTEQGC